MTGSDVRHQETSAPSDPQRRPAAAPAGTPTVVVGPLPTPTAPAARLPRNESPRPQVPDSPPSMTAKPSHLTGGGEPAACAPAAESAATAMDLYYMNALAELKDLLVKERQHTMEACQHALKIGQHNLRRHYHEAQAANYRSKRKAGELKHEANAELREKLATMDRGVLAAFEQAKANK